MPAAADTRSLPRYAAARRARDGTYSVGIFDANGQDLRAIPLPARGHDLAICPSTSRCVAFARRPGTFAVAFSLRAADQPIAFSTVADRHFYGHGVFSRDGRLLFSTENDFQSGQGVIGVYDASDRFRRVGEFRSYGIGPHDMALMRNGSTLVVANGGMREHPDFGDGRRVLNAGALETSLAYIDAGSGDLLERHDLAKGKPISLRHLDVGHDDTVIIGAQLEKGAEPGTPVAFTHRRQQPMAACSLPQQLLVHLKGYISSVAVDRSGQIAALTSSRGAVAVLLDLKTQRLLRTVTMQDISGIAPGCGTRDFLTTSGHGVIARVSADVPTRTTVSRTAWQWDNHAIAFSAPQLNPDNPM